MDFLYTKEKRGQIKNHTWIMQVMAT